MKIKRPLCLAVICWIMMLPILVRFGLAGHPQGYEQMKSALDGRQITVTGRIRAVTGQNEDRVYELDRIKINTDMEISSVTYAEEIFLSVPAEMKILFYVQEAHPELGCGDTVRVEGRASFPSPPSNPGQFDDEVYCINRDILFRMYNARPGKISQGKGLRRSLQALRDHMLRGYAAGLDPEEAAVMAGITLGDTSMISGGVKDLFREGGIAHILAISALHVNLLAMSLYRAARSRALPIPLCAALSLSMLGAYTVMTGQSLPAIRAFVMFAVWCLAQCCGRSADTATSLALAAAVLTVRRPLLLWDAGFCLSFGAGLGICLLGSPLRALMGKRFGGIRTSAAVFLGTAPICARFFFQITPWSFLVNLFVLSAMSLLFAFGCAGSFAALLWDPAGRFILSVCHYLIRWFMFLCEAHRKLPFAVLITGCPSRLQTGIYYLFLGLSMWMASRFFGKRRGRRKERRKGILKIAAIVLIAAGCTGIIAFHPPVSFRTVFLDVGQGDCTLIGMNGRSFLVDCGSSSVENVWSRRVSPALKYYGIRRLDGIFVSHGDSDHINGIRELLEGYERNLWGDNCADVSVGAIFAARASVLAGEGEEPADAALAELVRMAVGKEIEVTELAPGDELLAGGGRIICLYPDEADVMAAAGDANMGSMVLTFRGDKVTLLMTGDLEEAGEERLCRARLPGILEEPSQGDAPGREGEIRILKAGHHGSGNATSGLLLSVFEPEAAVISCGINNRYGHPARAVLERLQRQGTDIFRTDTGGAVCVDEKGRICYTVTKSFPMRNTPP